MSRKTFFINGKTEALKRNCGSQGQPDFFIKNSLSMEVRPFTYSSLSFFLQCAKLLSEFPGLCEKNSHTHLQNE